MHLVLPKGPIKGNTNYSYYTNSSYLRGGYDRFQVKPPRVNIPSKLSPIRSECPITPPYGRRAAGARLGADPPHPPRATLIVEAIRGAGTTNPDGGAL
jgi:hypothetical protein